jgi:regulator of sirC expression with transglutaminase-like and TPR domain
MGRAMRRVAAFVLSLALLAASCSAAPALFSNPDLEAKIEALFAQDRDLADVKFAVDEMVNPNFKAEAGKAELDNWTKMLQALLPDSAQNSDKIAALNKLIYVAGPWNDNRSFAYDQSDPKGTNPERRFLLAYMSSRRGNCVTMPTLLMLLGKRIGLNITMSVAPFHSFNKLYGNDGREWNIEATTNVRVTRTEKYRADFPMTDKAIANGVYMKALNHEETVAYLATFLVEHYIHEKMPREAIVASSVLLKHWPKSSGLLIMQASAYALILRQEIIPFYKHQSEMPPDVRAFADAMYERNQTVFAEAEALGWSENEGKPGIKP